MASPTCRSPIAPPLPTWRPSTAAPAASSPSTKRRCVISSLSGRPPEQIALVEAYAKAQGMWRINGAKPADYTDVLELDLATVEPSLAGPKRPQDRVPLSKAKTVYQAALKAMADERKKKLPDATGCAEIQLDGQQVEIRDGAVTIAAITSCTNTSNPYVLMAAGPAGAQRRAARAQGQALGQDQPRAGFARGHRLPAPRPGCSTPLAVHRLQRRGLRLHHLHRQLRAAASPRSPRASRRATSSPRRCCRATATSKAACIRKSKMNFLASPPLVVAYALAGTHERRPAERRARHMGPTASPCCCANIWPSDKEVADAVHATLDSAMFRKSYSNVFAGEANWQAIKIPPGKIYAWKEKSTYVRNPPYFEGMTMTPRAVHRRHRRARASPCWATRSPPTTSRRPATSAKTSPAAKYLVSQGVQPIDFNSYGARRGNHEVMMRGTFAQHPPAQPARARHRRRRHRARAHGRADVDLRRRHALQAGRHAAGHPRGQGIRHRLVARLGRQGPAPAGHARRDGARASSASTART